VRRADRYRNAEHPFRERRRALHRDWRYWTEHPVAVFAAILVLVVLAQGVLGR
jgi:hypothetical protein